jgi:DnaJ-domain-containing protein 1
MGIFDRLGRLARAEVSELKRVLREAKDESLPDPEAEEAERRRLIAEAEAELARAEGDLLAAEIEAGAAAWGRPASEAAGASDALERGADLWAAREPGTPQSARPGRTHAFPRDVREAYATLELPLGADREAIEAAYRTLLQRYHPDRHAQSPHLLQVATELTIRMREARDRLLAWLEGA